MAIKLGPQHLPRNLAESGYIRTRYIGFSPYSHLVSSLSFFLVILSCAFECLLIEISQYLFTFIITIFCQDLERQLSWPVLDLGREILEEVVHENLRDVAFTELRASTKG